MHLFDTIIVYVKLKDRKRSLSGKNNHNALWHVKICHDAKVVLRLLKEMTTTSSDFMKIPQTAEEVAYQQMDIFCMFGAQFILHSDNGREFAKQNNIKFG